jgi:hypothetical protein
LFNKERLWDRGAKLLSKYPGQKDIPTLKDAKQIFIFLYFDDLH